MSKRTGIVIYSVFAAVFVLGILLFYVFNKPDGDLITIQSDGRTIQKIDLTTVSEAYETEVFHDGYNKIRISKTGVEVIEADCPDKLCIRQSESEIYPIVCLPHKLVINRENRR